MTLLDTNVVVAFFSPLAFQELNTVFPIPDPNDPYFAKILDVLNSQGD